MYTCVSLIFDSSRVAHSQPTTLDTKRVTQSSSTSKISARPATEQRDIYENTHDRWNFIRLSSRARPAGININFHCHALFTTRCRFWRSRFIPRYRANGLINIVAPLERSRARLARLNAARSPIPRPGKGEIATVRSLITCRLFTADRSDKRIIFFSPDIIRASPATRNFHSAANDD